MRALPGIPPAKYSPGTELTHRFHRGSGGNAVGAYPPQPAAAYPQQAYLPPQPAAGVSGPGQYGGGVYAGGPGVGGPYPGGGGGGGGVGVGGVVAGGGPAGQQRRG